MAEPRPGRWRALLILTLVRASMAVQFQSVAALAPALTGQMGLSHALYGWLIGLYLLPGIALAVPGGWMGHAVGERRTVMAGLTLMTAGGLWLGLATAPAAMLAARALAGAGAIALNVQVTKMAADWFQGRSSVLAMGFLVTAWPAGMGLAMVALPPLLGLLPLGWLHWLAAAPAALGLAVLALLYPAHDPDAGAAPRLRLDRQGLMLALSSGGVWGLYNAALIVGLGFGPEAFAARGASPVEASAIFSVAAWGVAALTIPGALLALRLPWPDAFQVAGLVAGGALALALWSAGPGPGAALLAFAFGASFGAIAPLVMGLPAATVAAPARGLAYGVFFTVYYIAMALLPPLTGGLRDLTGTPGIALWVVAALETAALLSFVWFLALRRQQQVAS